MKRSLYAVALAVALLLPALQAQAQSVPVTLTLGPRGGYSITEHAPFVGADFRIDDASLPFVYHLGFDYYLQEYESAEPDAPRWQFDVNSYVPLLVYSSAITLKLGGGFSVQRTAPPTGDETDWGVNGTAGFVLNPSGRFQPFVQSRFTVAQESTTDIMGGLVILLRR